MTAWRWLHALAIVAVALGTSRTVCAVEFFADDFEGYLDIDGIPSDALLEDVGYQFIEVNMPRETGAKWTVTNPGSRANPPTEDGSPSTGYFLISDSDASGGVDGIGSGMSHDVWSPEIDINNSPTVWIHFDCGAQLNDNGTVVVDVDVSVDDGANWINVFRRTAPSRRGAAPETTVDNADGFFGRLHLDVSAQVGGRPNFKFRLRQFEPDDDWWFAIDNLVVDDVPGGRGGSTILLGREDFAGGIPPAWDVVSLAVPPNTGNATWSVDDPCSRYTGGVTPRGVNRLLAPFALRDSECSNLPSENEYLVTPAADCTAATAVFLHFKSETLINGGVLQEVLLSLDGGASFEVPSIFTYTDPGASNALFDTGEEPFYAERALAVPAAIGESQVAFAFHYQAEGAGDHRYWAIDDVKVSANGAFPPSVLRTCANREFTVGAFNPASVSVSMSWRSIAGDEGFRVLANGNVVSGASPLPAGTTSFTHMNPAAGGTITYTLQSIVGGSVQFECAAPPVTVLSCPTDFTCCPNQGASTVNLSWTNGINVAGTGWRITRNGVPIRTVPLTQDSFLDTVPGPGTYNYELILNGGDPAQCPGLPLVCSASILGSEVMFAENFECYLDDADLVAGGWEIHEDTCNVENALWTLTDPGGRGNPPSRDGSPTTGKFMVSDSDAAGGADGQGTGRSHDIWSPSFSTMGQSTVWLHAAVAAILNNNGLCVFDIDVSAGPSPTAMPFGARLSGAQEAPTPVQTNACGFASFSFNSSTRELSYTINFSGLSATETLAHIHQAAPGVAGPPIHTLALGSPKIGSAVLTAAQATALTNGELYVNIHSEMFPNGEIRGQIGPDVSWVNVFRRVAPGRGVPPLPLADIPEGLPGGPQVGNADGFLGPLDLDISAVAANRPNVRLRFRQFEPDDDWWIAVDDILVDTVPHAGGNTTVLETEEFNDGFIPGSWDVLSNADELAVWRAMDECVISLLNFNGGMFPDSQDGLQVHHMDTGFAHVFRDTSCTPQVQDELLVTPTLDLSAATAAYLHFKSALVLANATPEVLLSIDGGATFDTANPVFSYLRGAGVYRSLDNGEMYYNEYIFSVPAAAGQARVAFAFHYLNRGAEPLGWAVDDVKVTADQPQTRVAFNRGDTNDDGLINLTDGVRLLNFLFLGGPDTTCKETQDVNNDKTINITDGVAVFNFLFLGGNAPADPGPVTQPRSCGLDPDPPGSDGDLGCQSYSAANC